MIVLGGVAYHYVLGQFELLPLWSSKINTVMQILLVLLVMLQQLWIIEFQQLVIIGKWLVVASVVNSGTEYVFLWGLRAWQQMKKS